MRIERLIPCSPKDLWRALIEQTELGEHGALLRLPLPAGVPGTLGRITAYESGKILECVWGSDVLRWELHPRLESTLLVFTHAECAAQWLAYLDSIAAAAIGTGEIELSA
jgi:hypothetical protein